jgi:predicted transcriptional regulator
MAESKDRHKKAPFQLRLHRDIRRQLEALAMRNRTDMTEEITRAVRERLEREGLWPLTSEEGGAA